MSGIDIKRLDKTIGSAQDYLFSRQYDEGYWYGLLEADVTVVTDFIPLMRIFGIRNPDREKKVIKYAVKHQNRDGSWSLFYGGPGSVDVTLRTYFSLKICGVSPDLDYMNRAKKFIKENGGIEATNTYTKIILALFGQYS